MMVGSSVLRLNELSTVSTLVKLSENVRAIPSGITADGIVLVLILGSASTMFTSIAATPFTTAELVTMMGCEPNVAVADAVKSKLAKVAAVCRLLSVKPTPVSTLTCAPSRLLPLIWKFFVSVRRMLAGVMLLTAIVALSGMILMPFA